MKKLILFIFPIIILLGCQQNEEPVILQETGVVVNYAGAEYCSIIIELDNGQTIQPLRYPEGFVFVQGQRLLVNYTELPNIVSTCGKGIVSEILSIEEIDCGAPVTEPELEEYNTMPNDPVIIHEASVNDDCLYLKVEYSGGCRNHYFNLVKINEDDYEKDTAVLELRHDANGDVCEAALSKDLQFSLVSLKTSDYKRLIFKAILENGDTYTDLFELEP